LVARREFAAWSEGAFGDVRAAAVRVSAASAWEIAIKSQTGRLPFREPVAVWMPAAIEDSGIAHAQLEDLTVVTSVVAFDEYDVKVLDGRR
jgi:PIN domain nuclease of toxin-antitoxin system